MQMMQLFRDKRLLLVFVLGFSSGVPLSLITTTLQAWFASSGMPILSTGMLSLLGLPYLFKVIWSPLLDYYSFFTFGRRRSWILITQIILLLGFNGFSWLNPGTYSLLMIIIAVLLACCSATQDIAIDAHRTEYLPIEKYGMGTALASLGYRCALLITGGIALILANSYGWSVTYRVMGLLMLPGIIAILYSKEPCVDYLRSYNLCASFLEALQELYNRDYFLPLILFILCYKFGEAFTATTSGVVMPFLINGMKFSLSTIGVFNQMIGVNGIILGGLIAGMLLSYISIYRALLIFGLLQALSNLLFLFLAILGKHVLLLAIAVFFDNLATGMGSTALVVLLMRLVNHKFTAIQLSLLIVVSTIPRILSGPIAAILQIKYGWIGVYQLAFVLSLLFLPFLLRLDNLLIKNSWATTSI